MIYILEVDDSTRAGKRIVKDAEKARNGVKFRSPAINGVPPKGYYTSDEAYKIMLEITNRLCKKYGILK